MKWLLRGWRVPEEVEEADAEVVEGLRRAEQQTELPSSSRSHLCYHSNSSPIHVALSPTIYFRPPDAIHSPNCSSAVVRLFMGSRLRGYARWVVVP